MSGGGRQDDTPDERADERPLVDFDAIPVAAVHMRRGRLVAVNDAFKQMAGNAVERVLGRDARELIEAFVIPDDAAFVDGARTAADQGELPPREVWFRATDRQGVLRVFRVLWRTMPGSDPADGEHVVFLIRADVDARERELAERLTGTAADLLRCPDETAVLERAADALCADGCTVTFLLLREGDPLLAYGPTRTPLRAEHPGSFTAVRPPREILTRINPQFLARRAAFLQRPDDLVREVYPADIAARVAPSLRAQRSVQVPLFVADQPYGAMVVTDDRLTHVSVGTLEMYGQLVAAAIENVRLHQRAQARLDEMQRLQGELVERERLAALGEAAAIMAHEVRNPIGALLNAVTLLERGEAVTNTPDAQLRRMIVEEAARLERLVTDLLALGRPLAPRVRPTDLALAAERAADVLRARDELSGCVIDPVQGHGAALAAVDPELAELALLNVLRNAADASPPGGHVRVRVREERGGDGDGDGGDATRAVEPGSTASDTDTRAARCVAVDVEDSGPGLSEEVTRRMFEPFFTTRATGTGIGLAVVRRVLDAHQGTLGVGRSATGGARVTLRLPAWRDE